MIPVQPQAPAQPLQPLQPLYPQTDPNNLNGRVGNLENWANNLKNFANNNGIPNLPALGSPSSPSIPAVPSAPDLDNIKAEIAKINANLPIPLGTGDIKSLLQSEGQKIVGDLKPVVDQAIKDAPALAAPLIGAAIQNALPSIGAAVGSVIPGAGTIVGTGLGSVLAVFLGGMLKNKLFPPASNAPATASASATSQTDPTLAGILSQILNQVNKPQIPPTVVVQSPAGAGIVGSPAVAPAVATPQQPTLAPQVVETRYQTNTVTVPDSSDAAAFNLAMTRIIENKPHLAAEFRNLQALKDDIKNGRTIT